LHRKQLDVRQCTAKPYTNLILQLHKSIYSCTLRAEVHTEKPYPDRFQETAILRSRAGLKNNNTLKNLCYTISWTQRRQPLESNC